ncbi:MAG: MBL fold metallo-hydrolase [Dehalococcoidia bacterium]
MDITWLGHACFRLRARDVAIVTDPCPPEVGYRLGRLSADVVTLSHDHPGHTYLKAVAGSPRVVGGPGEYEIAGAFITGVATYHDRQRGEQRGKNTVYVIAVEGLRVCHLGDLGHAPTSDQVEEMGGVDVLLVPVGGQATLSAAQAAEVVSLLEPRVVVPMHYQTPATSVPLDPVEPFLKEMGQEAVEATPRLSLTRSNLPHELQVAVLDYRG